MMMMMMMRFLGLFSEQLAFAFARRLLGCGVRLEVLDWEEANQKAERELDQADGDCDEPPLPRQRRDVHEAAKELDGDRLHAGD